MPGRLRKGEGVSNKTLEGCCLKCCKVICQVSPWNKLICYSVIILAIATLIIVVEGGFIALDEKTATNIRNSSRLCGNGNGTDLRFLFTTDNIYVWYLTNTGIIVTVLVTMTAVCCVSYVGLCCGLNLPKVVRILAVLGFILLAAGMAIYITWVSVGGWLISTMSDSLIVTGDVCRRIIAYVISMVMYIIVLIGVIIASCIWAAHGTKEKQSKKVRASKKSELKMPPVSII